MSDLFSTTAEQRATQFAALLQEFRDQFHQPLFDSVGVAAPPLSKRQLALLLGVSPTLIVKYENAEIDPFDIRWGVMNRISVVLGLSLDELNAVLAGQQDPSALLRSQQPNLSKKRGRRSISD
ncbi:helix-turn-helix transcriptional regulator [Synechococcus elongatus]|uniref:Helix-turn-helix transcriptional regulator n=1 Tax=Synechococcus elongatus PCC 11802 TaxID=2283154 RepID=A0AAT9JSP5_SYNEL|nr:helix-turn-helix transcriptional regulator [Synechococcus elongatus]QFZ92185.1 XRE family transcriptional regulator [Synechococcus elongatus PCC 11802]